MRLREQIHIDAPAVAVWAALADWERQAAWMPDVAWMRLVSRERELGARLQVRTRIFGVPAVTDLLVVTGWRPPERMEIEHRGLVTGRGVWDLSVEGDGTRFTWTEEMSMPPPWLGELAMRVYAPFQALMLRRSLSNLKREVERSHGT